jgi:hypothetical protein
MPMPTRESGDHFNNFAEGVLGVFKTIAGEVIYVQTSARLKDYDSSPKSLLTGKLTFAREELDVKSMDFNQLLQRDLDDHRIAHELVPYLLKDQSSGPAFFPPILVALLPFDNGKPAHSMPSKETLDKFEDQQYKGAFWKNTQSGDVFRLQQQIDAKGNIDSFGSSVLRWNDHRAKLIVMDGQHRAMALVAIHRTLTKTWNASGEKSARYQPFYEGKIEELKKANSEAFEKLTKEGLDFPVTICIFSEFLGRDNPHVAARKIFVDVNKQAKPPSESRLILISDVSLDHVLARELLNVIRKDQVCPLYCIEYDNPEPKSSTPRRWNALTNLEILLRSVIFCCFGPSEVLTRVESPASRPQGKPNKTKAGNYFREEMKLADIVPIQFEDGPRTIKREEIGLDVFPIFNQNIREKIFARFMSIWGSSILRLLTEILPFKAHIEAASEVYKKWGSSGEVSSALAKEALFDGVGMYWTLEKGFLHQCDLGKVTKPQDKDSEYSVKTSDKVDDVVDAWNIASISKKKQFEKMRASAYLDGSSAEAIEKSGLFYSTAITYANQVGLVLAWATVAKTCLISDSSDRSKALSAFITCINNSLENSSGRELKPGTRKLFLTRDPSSSVKAGGGKGSRYCFNRLRKLDSPFASYFRYFWLELLLVPENEEALSSGGVNWGQCLLVLSRARRFYVNRVYTDIFDSLRAIHPGKSLVPLEKKAKETTISTLTTSYCYWFGVEEADAKALFISALEDNSTDASVSESDLDDDDESVIDESAGTRIVVNSEDDEVGN